MNKKLTARWLTSKGACQDGIEWFKDNVTETDPIKVLRFGIKHDKLDWVNWLIVRLMTHRQLVRYACYAARQTLPDYESEYPDDRRVRDAIVAAKRWAKNPTEDNARAAIAAYIAASIAARAASSAAYSVANADIAAYRAERSTTMTKILRYGIRLLQRDHAGGKG